MSRAARSARPSRRARRPAGAGSAAPTRSRCPIASTLDLVGDKWTLLVVRDLLFRGPLRFADLLASPERIASNLLAERLERLEAAGVVGRRLYQEHPPRYAYELTEKGRDFGPVFAAIGRWAARHLPGTLRPTPAMIARMGADDDR